MLASSAGKWDKYVMIEFRMLMIMSRKNETQTENWKSLRNTLFSRGANGLPCYCLFASSAGEWNKHVMIEFRMLVIMSQKENETRTRSEIIA